MRRNLTAALLGLGLLAGAAPLSAQPPIPPRAEAEVLRVRLESLQRLVQTTRELQEVRRRAQALELEAVHADAERMQAEADRAAAELARTQQELDRLRRLAAEGLASAEDVARTEAAGQAAQAREAQMRAHLAGAARGLESRALQLRAAELETQLHVIPLERELAETEARLRAVMQAADEPARPAPREGGEGADNAARPTGRLAELLEQRRETLRELLKLAEARVQQGEGGLGTLQAARRELLAIELELAPHAERRRDLLAAAAAQAAEFERALARQVEAGEVSIDQLLRARAERLELEIRLERE